MIIYTPMKVSEKVTACSSVNPTRLNIIIRTRSRVPTPEIDMGINPTKIADEILITNIGMEL